MRFLIRIIVNALVLAGMAAMFPNMIYLQSFGVALLTGAILAILNSTIKPILQVISLPITFLTFGLFALIINGLMLELATQLVGSKILINGFLSVILIAIMLSLVQSTVFKFLTNNFRL